MISPSSSSPGRANPASSDGSLGNDAAMFTLSMLPETDFDKGGVSIVCGDIIEGYSSSITVPFTPSGGVGIANKHSFPFNNLAKSPLPEKLLYTRRSSIKHESSSLARA